MANVTFTRFDEVRHVVDDELSLFAEQEQAAQSVNLDLIANTPCPYQLADVQEVLDMNSSRALASVECTIDRCMRYVTAADGELLITSDDAEYFRRSIRMQCMAILAEIKTSFEERETDAIEIVKSKNNAE